MKRKFSEKEDQIILHMVDKLGIHSWNEISKRISETIGRRTSRQCRERWRHYLKPEISQSSWTKDEDSILEEKYNEFGPKWSIIATFLPGRTEVNAKNRWTRLCRMRRKQSQNNLTPKTKTKKTKNAKPSVQIDSYSLHILPIFNSSNTTNFEQNHISASNIQSPDINNKNDIIANQMLEFQKIESLLNTDHDSKVNHSLQIQCPNFPERTTTNKIPSFMDLVLVH